MPDTHVATDYGSEETAMRLFQRQGEARALALDNHLVAT